MGGIPQACDLGDISGCPLAAAPSRNVSGRRTHPRLQNGAITVDTARFAALAQVCTAAVACQRPSPAIADGFPSSIESERLRSFGLARRRRRRSTRRGRGTRHPPL